MNKLYKQFVSVMATGSMLLNIVTPVSAVTLEITGNGSDSDSEIKLDVDHTTSVVQSNNADVYNEIHASADTGGNNADDNTGGDVNIETGDATTEVKVENTLNSNTASVDCCQSQDVDVLISGNGSGSDNDVDLDMNDGKDGGTFVGQYNYADVTNKVYADSDTGDNDANDNTGGDVEVITGDASTSVSVSTTANANWAKVGGNGDGEGGSVSLRILGNGSDSDNEIELDLDSALALVQSNVADVFNKVDADADTGDNDADDNTGGTVSIETGDADTTVEVDNMVNFNWADVDCGCVFDVLAKIAGNGEDTDNDIKAYLDDTLEVFQDNCGTQGVKTVQELYECELENKVDADADTGDNDADDNTGGVEGDPSIETGDASTDVGVSNSGNSNVFGSETPGDWPEFDFNFNISLSWAQLMALLGN